MYLTRTTNPQNASCVFISLQVRSTDGLMTCNFVTAFQAYKDYERGIMNGTLFTVEKISL